MKRALAAALLLAACAKGPEALRVGSKPFTESELLAEMVAQLAEADGARVERRPYLGGSVCFDSLKSGGLDAYAEYTGTGLVNILGEPASGDRAAVYARVSSEFARRWGLSWLPPLGFENSYALVARSDRAAKEGWRRISDLRGRRGLVCGFDLEFADRPDGWKGLRQAYGLDACEDVKQMNPGLLYDALARGQVDVISGYSTDGRIATLGLRVLEDDRRFFPPYEAAVLLGPQARGKAPRLEARLRALAGRVSPEEMRSLNAAVDSGGKRVRDAVREYLLSEGLLD